MKGSAKTSAATKRPVAEASPSPSPPKRFALTGPSVAVDPAVNAYREDVADIALTGQVIASHYAEPWMRVCRADTPLHADAALATPKLGTLDEGDDFAVLDCGRGLAWGYRVTDHRVGYVAVSAFKEKT